MSSANFHSFNKEILTVNKNILVASVKFAVGSTGAVGTISQSKSNFVSGITRNSAGNYTVQFTRPYPYSYLFIEPVCQRNAITDAGCRMEYDVGSFSATNGQFKIVTVAAASSGTFASGTLTCVTNANMADGDYVTIGDGLTTPVLYEYDKSSNGVTGGRQTWAVAGGAGTASDVADTLVTAITNGPQKSLRAVNASGVVTVTSLIPGTAPNVTITENVANAGFTVTGMSGGVAPGTAVDPPSGSEVHIFCVFMHRKGLSD